jgi:hypothetical protein
MAIKAIYLYIDIRVSFRHAFLNSMSSISNNNSLSLYIIILLCIEKVLFFSGYYGRI